MAQRGHDINVKKLLADYSKTNKRKTQIVNLFLQLP